MSYNAIDSIVKKYFNHYKLTKNNKEYEVEVNCSNTLENTIFIINTDDSIYINLIYAPCDGFKGKEIVRKIINIANDLHITNIELEDQSDIYIKDDKDKVICSINLAPLNILLKGHTWYNTMGFVYSDFEKDKDYNTLLINMTTTEFFYYIESIVDGLKEDDIDSIRLNAFKKLIEKKDHTTSFTPLVI